MLGSGNSLADKGRSEGFIGGDWGIRYDLSESLPENYRDFNDKFIPIYLEQHPEKTKIAAGLACGMLHTICKGIRVGDVVLSPDGQGSYFAGTVSSDYKYFPEENLPHRREVEWFSEPISKDEMSEALSSSVGSRSTVCDITKHSDEIEALISGGSIVDLNATDPTIEDPSIFALEKHLEDFLIANWSSTELGRHYDVFTEDGEIVGQQYPTDTGPIDILAVSKDKKELLVVELKKGRASDAVVGQIQRYMGYVLDELAESGQSVRGVIIAMKDDLRLRRALRMTNKIDFYRYEVSFKLIKSSE